mmetsp:Transcript_44093/g.136729  ORF Transcript_44093/g.136729 Transcript_44093/m.136729 type:complete len:224 (-) Transcript_44093:254-925(-)
MVAVGLLHRLGKLNPDKAILLGDRTEALLHSPLHALQAAHVDVRVGLLHELPQLLGVLGHLCLDVHLLSGGILLLTGDGVVIPELLPVLGGVLLVLVVIEEGLGVGHAHEEPRKALELPGAVSSCAGCVVEEQAEVGTHWGNARACGKHDDVGLGVLRQEHLGTCRPRYQHVVTHVHVADVVGADAPIHLVVGEVGASLVRLVLANLPVRVIAIHLHHSLHAE